MRDHDKLKDRICQRLEEFFPRFQEITLSIHSNPELGNEEFFASKLLSDELKSQGFQVEYPFCEQPTAFRAEKGEGGPAVAFLAEYDALPEIGHACGHSASGTASTMAAIALSEVLPELGGRAVVIGTPDEEGQGGKIALIEAGGFRNVDWAMMVHAGGRTILDSRYKAARSFEFLYKGRTAHAVSCPEKGINALDALVHFYTQLQVFRLTLREDARAPMVIVEGGVKANIVPDRARARLTARAADEKYLEYVVDRIRELAMAAAEKYGAALEIVETDRPYREMNSDQSMLHFYRKNLEKLDTAYDPEPNTNCGSTDIGNVSQILPAIHPSMAIVEKGDLAGHTVEFARATSSEYGLRAMLEAAKAMAMTAVDLLMEYPEEKA